jgi:hypothetical protein
LNQDGAERENGEVAEITQLVELSSWPEWDGSRSAARAIRDGAEDCF